MHFLRASLPQHRHDWRRRRGADDAVVHEDNAPAFQQLRQRVVLELDAHLADTLIGFDEGAAHIAVLHQPLDEGDTRLLRVADCRGGRGVRHADDDVRVHWMLARELRAQLHPHRVDELPTDHAVRPREVNVLKDAERALRLGGLEALDAVLRDAYDLSRFKLAHERSSDVVERAGLGSDDPATIKLAQAERPVAHRVAGGHQLLGRQHDEGIRPDEASHHVRPALLPGARRRRERLSDDLGVGSSAELNALLFQV